MRRAVFVVGPTGSGKSRLGIDIACACNGEVISADAIQLYRGLDTATAKVPLGERRGIAHHLMSFLPPRGSMTVRDFRAVASAVIDDVLSRGKLPVVVGGTGYYVQALLKESLLEEDESAAREAGGGGGGGVGAAPASTPGGEGPGWGGHTRLATVDPLMATRLHPNDTRRIHRALHVFDTTGVPYSTVLERQASRLAAAASAAPVLHTRVYWLSVDDRAVHDQRLDARVESMVAGGLVGEIDALREALAATAPGEEESGGGGGASNNLRGGDTPSPLTLRAYREHVDRTGKGVGVGVGVGVEEEGGSYSGLLQAIGYKEFHEYLRVKGGGGSETEVQAALGQGVDILKVVTHAYARKQDRWIRNRFEKRGVPLIKLDTSGVGVGVGVGGLTWEGSIESVVVRDVKAWMGGATATAGAAAGGGDGPLLLPPTVGGGGWRWRAERMTMTSCWGGGGKGCVSPAGAGSSMGTMSGGST